MRRPPISEETLFEHLDWLGQQNATNHVPEQLAHLHKVAELAVRVQGNRAQAKATAATLVQEGVVDESAVEHN